MSSVTRLIEDHSNTDREHALLSSDYASHEPTNYILCHIQYTVFINLILLQFTEVIALNSRE